MANTIVYADDIDTYPFCIICYVFNRDPNFGEGTNKIVTCIQCIENMRDSYPPRYGIVRPIRVRDEEFWTESPVAQCGMCESSTELYVHMPICDYHYSYTDQDSQGQQDQEEQDQEQQDQEDQDQDQYRDALNVSPPPLPEHNHVDKSCEVMKKECGTEIDPILQEDWCEIDPKEYTQLKKTESHEGNMREHTYCFSVSSLITSFEAGLEFFDAYGIHSPKFPENPLTREPISNDLLLRLSAQYVSMGKNLPPHVNHLVWGIINKDKITDLKTYFGMA